MCNCCKNKDEIKLEDILNYSFYDEEHKLTVVLNREKLKQLFNADRIIFEEIEHR